MDNNDQMNQNIPQGNEQKLPEDPQNTADSSGTGGPEANTQSQSPAAADTGQNDNGQAHWGNDRNNWNQWRNPHHQVSDNNPYYNQPTSSPYLRQPFATASMVCGILAMLASCTGIFAVPIGCLGFLFAILGYRKGRRSSQLVLTGFALSCVGLVSAMFMLVSSVMMLPDMLRDSNYRAQIDTMTQQLYGKSFTDILKEGYGFDLDKYLEGTK